jgi:hypothetical protein
MLFLRKLQRKSRNNLHIFATILLGAILLLSSCQKEENRAVLSIAHTDSYDIWPDSLDMHGDVILRAMSDSLLLMRTKGANVDSIKAGRIPDDRMQFSSAFPLLDFLYHLEAAAPSSGKFTAQTPYEIYLNPLQNDSARIMLEGRTRNGLVIPYETHSLGWPIINVNADWLLAASELATVRGDNRWLRSIGQTAAAVLDNDRRICYNPTSKLFTGLPRYLASTPEYFPQWMGVADLAQTATLAVNVNYCIAMRTLDIEADSLLYAIKRELWLPNVGGFSAMAYGIPTAQTALRSTDNLSQSIAIISGILPDAMVDAIISKTPMTDMGISLYEPMLPEVTGTAKSAIAPNLLQTAWAVAASRSSNEAAYSAAVGSLLATEGKRLLSMPNQLPSFRSSMTALILRGFLGMSFTADGVSFSPNIPECLPGEKVIKNLRYRDCVLNIKIEGTGRIISTFTIDGETAEPQLDGDLEGTHDITITLAGPEISTSEFNRQEEKHGALLPPIATWSNMAVALSPGVRRDSTAVQRADDYPEIDADDYRYKVYINGILTDEISEPSYQCGGSTSVVQFCAFTEDYPAGFSSEPRLCIAAGGQRLISAADIAKCGTKLLKDKKIAEKYVESNRFHNRNIRLDVTVPADGRYLINIHYVNGLGIVNSQHKTALRRLKVNGKEQGIFIFQQRNAASAPKDSGDSWQQMTDWTNTVIAQLSRGENHLEVLYFQPSPVYTDPNANVILIDALRLLPAN